MYNDGMGSLNWVAGEGTPRKTLITRLFNYGTWKEWQQMNRRFTQAQVREVLENPLRGMWTRRGRALAEMLYDCRLPDSSLISFDA